jgi:hypothetical protein
MKSRLFIFTAALAFALPVNAQQKLEDVNYLQPAPS